MPFAVEMGSGSMIYIYIYTPSLLKIGSGIGRLIGGYRDRRHGDLISLLSCFVKIRKMG
jgi:hypothetical protein